MNKTLRIFAKDTRHLWPEILLSLALVAGFAATGHFGWPQFWRGSFRAARDLQLWMEVLMPISWWLLISRAVHDESLVGDRQFWITRPYGWPRILGAKLIFVATWILLPYLLAQCFLLHQAHLNPLAVLPGLAFTLVALFGFFLLPLIALSAVTPTVTRIFLIFFALAVYAGLTTYIVSTFLTPAEWVPGGDPKYLSILLLLIPAVTLCVTLLQYARRRTAISAALLLASLIAVTAGCIAENDAPRRLSDFSALAAGERPPIAVAFNPDTKLQSPLAEDPKLQAQLDAHNEHPVEIPILFSSIAPGHAVIVTAETVTISAPGMENKTLPWAGAHVELFDWNSSRPLSSFDVPSAGEVDIPLYIYRKVAGKMMSLHVTYAVTELEAESPVNVPFDGHFAKVPEHGYCSKTDDGGSAICQYALVGPSLTQVSWTLKETCGVPSSAGDPRTTWIGSIDPGERELDFNPVVTSGSFTTREVVKDKSRVYSLCPVDSFTFTKYHVTRKRLVEVALPPVDPRLYVQFPSQLQNAAQANGSAANAETE